jgi:hypothetical protein
MLIPYRTTIDFPSTFSIISDISETMTNEAMMSGGGVAVPTAAGFGGSVVNAPPQNNKITTSNSATATELDAMTLEEEKLMNEDDDEEVTSVESNEAEDNVMLTVALMQSYVENNSTSNSTNNQQKQQQQQPGGKKRPERSRKRPRPVDRDTSESKQGPMNRQSPSSKKPKSKRPTAAATAATLASPFINVPNPLLNPIPSPSLNAVKLEDNGDPASTLGVATVACPLQSRSGASTAEEAAAAVPDLPESSDRRKVNFDDTADGGMTSTVRSRGFSIDLDRKWMPSPPPL